jgi:hypothetical protein
MTATVRRASRLPVGRLHASRRALVAGMVVGVVAAGAAVVAAVAPGPARIDPTAPARSHSALVAYVQAVSRLNDDGAGVVMHGMRPGVADVAQSRYADDVLERMAAGWTAEFRELRSELRALTVPAAAAGAAARLDVAYSLYLDTAESLLAATGATGAERQQLIEDAVSFGRQADLAFDEALAELDRQQARAGIDPQEARR